MAARQTHNLEVAGSNPASATIFGPILAFLAALVLAVPSFAEVPRACLKYKKDLIRTARAIEGMDAPMAVYGAQMLKESSCNAKAQSPYAKGLTQFTDSTADWISTMYSDLKPANVWNPGWALRAMVRYDMRLYRDMDFEGRCDRMAAALSAYNGGGGWVRRDARLAKAAGDNPRLWWGHVEKHTNRADWARRENRDYPRRILLEYQAMFRHWGNGDLVCGEMVAM